MSWINYILKGFGYQDLCDFSNTVFALPISTSGYKTLMCISIILGTIKLFIKEYTGLDGMVFLAFIFLICAEFYTGMKVSRKIRGERFKSRKFGRMTLKIGVYVFIVGVLYAFAQGVKVPVLFGFGINPFLWLYYVVFISIVFQLFISWMENLGALGYSETKGVAGIVLRKLNKWFEFDGTKNNGEE